MKTTDTENPNPIRAQLHPEQLSTDTNTRRLYKVNVHSTVYFETNIQVKALSEEEAMNAAEKRAKLLNDDEWNMVDHDMFAFEAHEVWEGGRHV